MFQQRLYACFYMDYVQDYVWIMCGLYAEALCLSPVAAKEKPYLRKNCDLYGKISANMVKSESGQRQYRFRAWRWRK